MKANYRARCARINRLLSLSYGQPAWPGPQNPLDVLMSAVLTQISSPVVAEKACKAVVDSYKSWERAADASADALARVLKGGGLAQQKAKTLAKLVKDLKKEHGTASLDFIKTMSVREAMRALETIEGVGSQIGASVILFSLGREICPVDANILRILQRIGIVPNNAVDESAFELLQPLVPTGLSYSFHLNLTRLGREACKAGKPRCVSCPVEIECRYPSKNIPRDR
jgi:endonuclease-3